LIGVGSSGADLRKQAVERSQENAPTEGDFWGAFARFSNNIHIAPLLERPPHWG